LLLVGFLCSQIEGRTISHDAGANSAGVLLGPCGSPTAEGPTGTNDDFTNLSIGGGVAMLGGLTASSATVIFKSTVENIGTEDDAFIVTAPSAPTGFRLEISRDFGEHYVDIDPINGSVTIPVAHHASVTFLVRITAPAGLAMLNSYDIVLRATSTINPEITNETIDRVYTSFIRLDKTVRVVSEAGAGGVVNAPPGSEIEFAITYTNISTAGSAGNSLLTAYNLVISDNGNAAPNNWGTTTEHVVGASDNRGGFIIGDREGSTSLTDIITSVEAGQTGVFKFRRSIK
jgi:hypothetical protein